MRVLLWTACSLFLISLIGGCVIPQETGGTFTLEVRDAQTGQELEDFLLITVLNRTETYSETVIGGSGGAYKNLEVRIRRTSSGDSVNEPLIFRPFIPLGLIWFTNDAFYGHHLFSPGYCPVGFGVDVEHEESVVITLSRERPGEPTSDREVLDIVGNAVRRLIPEIPESDPLRSELLELITGQVERIRAASKDRGILLSAKFVAEDITRRYGPQDADSSPARE